MQRRAQVHALYDTANDTVELCVGDVINCSSYRYAQAWVVGPNFTLIRNPDIDGSGYLTIPRSVTCCFENAIAHYSIPHTPDNNVEIVLVLNPDDGGLVKIFGKAFPETYEIQFISSVLDESVFITDTDPVTGIEHTGGFDIETPYAEIIEYINDRRKTRSSFMIWYNDYSGTSQKLHLSRVKLPKSWRSESGSELLTDTLNFGIWYFQGPTSDYEHALDAVKTYFAEHNVQISIYEGKKYNHFVRAGGIIMTSSDPVAFAPNDIQEIPI